MRKKIKIMLFFLLTIFEVLDMNAQKLPIIRDTFYFLVLATALPNGRPVTNLALMPSLNILKAIKKDSQDQFICEFYKSAIVSENPTLGLDKVLSLSSDSASIQLAEIIEGLHEMDKFEKKINLYFKDGTSITMYINKIDAYFWEIPLSEKPVVSHSFDPLCYNKNYYLTLKKVVKCLKIKKAAVNSIGKD